MYINTCKTNYDCLDWKCHNRFICWWPELRKEQNMNRTLWNIKVIVEDWSWSYSSSIYNYLTVPFIADVVGSNPTFVFFFACASKKWQNNQRIWWWPHSGRSRNSGEVYSIQYYVIKFVNDLRQVGGFLRLSALDITEILLKVTLNTINPNPSIMVIKNICTHKNIPGESWISWYPTYLNR